MVAEHIERQVNLRFFFETACSRLNEMAVILERIAFHIRRLNIRVKAVKVPVNQILSDLPFFNSKEIRDLTKEVVKELREISEMKDKGADYLLSEKLRRCARKLFAASTLLQEEAEKVPEDEKIAAAQMTQM
jgi:hypothetical protein